jgi:hypothetical protein
MEVSWTAKTAAISLGVGVLLGAGAGLTLGWKIYHPKPVIETYHPAVNQPDGSVILESKPNPNAKPPHSVPSGAVVEHTTHVVVTPTQNPPVQGNPAAAIPCPPIQVDLTAIRLKDGSHRVIASSPDGTISGGSVDIPVEAARPQAEVPKWSASGLVGYDVFQKKRVYGALLNRSAGPFVFQAGFIGQTAFVGIGVRF